MEIQILKTKIVPCYILIKDRIIFLATESHVHIIDLKGDIFPDIDLQNIQVFKKSKNDEYVQSDRKIRFKINTIYIYKKYLIFLSTRKNVYFCKLGQKNIFQINIVADKIICDKKLLILQGDVIFEVKIKNNQVKIFPIVFHLEKINNFIKVGRKIIFQAGSSSFITKYSTQLKSKNREKEKTSTSIGSNSRTHKLINAFENIIFKKMVSNEIFCLFETEKDLIILSEHSNTIVISKPYVFYSANLVGSYVFVYSEKIMIYSALSGDKMRDLPMTIFKGCYDQESGLLLIQNDKIFITDATKIINRLLFTNSRKSLHEGQIQQNTQTNDSSIRRKSQKWIQSFLVNKNIFKTKSNLNSSLVTIKTPSLNLIDYETSITHKLYLVSEKINQKETFFNCSINSFKNGQLFRGLFFYARSGKKYNFDRVKVLNLCKNGHSGEKISFHYNSNMKIDIDISELIYFLSIRSVYMKTELDFLFFISIRLKMMKYIKYFLKFVNESNIRLKIIERMELRENTGQETYKTKKKNILKKQSGSNDEDEYYLYNNSIKDPISYSHVSINCPIEIYESRTQKSQPKNTKSEIIEEFSALMSDKRLKKLVIDYWIVKKPEKAILYFYETRNFLHVKKILLSKFNKIQNLKGILLKLRLYEKVVDVSLIKLYNIYFPNLLALLAKSNSIENIEIFFTEVVDTLRESQQIYKNVSKMDQNSKEVVKEALENITETESIEILKSTIDILCSPENEKKTAFTCDGKVIN